MNTLQPKKCAVLLLDFTPIVIDNYASDPAVVEKAASLSHCARAAGGLNVYVIPGSAGKNGLNLFAGDLHQAFAPTEGEFVLHKPKICSFWSTSLDLILREGSRDTVIIAGVATSGTVLSTTRSAYDRGYKVIVAEDACSDPDTEVHKALTQRVYDRSWVGLWRFADIVTVAELRRLFG